MTAMIALLHELGAPIGAPRAIFGQGVPAGTPALALELATRPRNVQRGVAPFLPQELVETRSIPQSLNDRRQQAGMGVMEFFGLFFPLAVAFAAGFALRGYMDRRGHLGRLAAYVDRLRRRGEMD